MLDGMLLVFPFLAHQGHALGGAPGVPGAGTASLPIGVPADSSLVGLGLRFQAVYFDPGASQRLSFTPGLRAALFR